jgi:hypothetical protein
MYTYIYTTTYIYTHTYYYTSRKKTRIRHTKVLIVLARYQWFTPVILDTQEAELRRIEVQNRPDK